MFDSVNISEFIKGDFCPDELISTLSRHSEAKTLDMFNTSANILKEYRDKNTPKPKKSQSAIPLNNKDVEVFDKYINSFIEQYTILFRIQSGKKTAVPEIDTTCALFEYLVLKYVKEH